MNEYIYCYYNVYKISDEVARIVLDLGTAGYPVEEIAKILAWDRKQVQGLLKSINEELAAEVELIAQTGWIGTDILRSGLDRDEEEGEMDSTMVRGGLGGDPEAKERVAEFRKGWFRAGTCTEPADRPRAEAAISRMYAALGATQPRFVWCDSPTTAQRELPAWGGRRSATREGLWRSLPPPLRAAFGNTKEAWPARVWLGDAFRASRAWLQDALAGLPGRNG